MQCVENCTDPDPRNHVLYEQPVWQTLQMFLGEMLCFLPVIFTWLRARRQSVRLPDDSEGDSQTSTKIDQSGKEQLRGWKILLLWLPTICDLTGTTLMNVGLLYTPVSLFQMTRGALVLFVGALSVVFLHRRLWLYQWVSLLTVMAGVSLVGLSGSLAKEAVKDSFIEPIVDFLSAAPLPSPEVVPKPEATKVLIGIFFILFAQLFSASQLVLEEKIMGRYAVEPLVAVGYEGLFGVISVLLLFPILSIPAVAAKSTFFDLPRGWHQMMDTPTVFWSGIACAFSISLYNFFGLSVTLHVSATARSLTDTCRTLSIWIISLILGWEKLLFPVSLIQISGFSLLVYGTFLFNDLVSIPPCIPGRPLEPEIDEEEADALLSASLDETALLPAALGQSGFDVVPQENQRRPARRQPTTGR
jgi:drug/metabolite transporter (DMT)-like permease